MQIHAHPVKNGRRCELRSGETGGDYVNNPWWADQLQPRPQEDCPWGWQKGTHFTRRREEYEAGPSTALKSPERILRHPPHFDPLPPRQKMGFYLARCVLASCS
ncbi:hypothetical protein MLD38_010451 [Melastoma candidum]|uniref:Uncharacterized protein n=1 Tax=Melastoma candidum TaxID=119954 RepID=A0ACB9R2Z4_9MYRT|nr:hypothetical protein MLD38_010451 [Melastoma candidum]